MPISVLGSSGIIQSLHEALFVGARLWAYDERAAVLIRRLHAIMEGQQSKAIWDAVELGKECVRKHSRHDLEKEGAHLTANASARTFRNSCSRFLFPACSCCGEKAFSVMHKGLRRSLRRPSYAVENDFEERC